MVDRDKIIKALEWCESNFKCDECPYHDTEYICCEDALRHDVLLLLKGEPETPQPARESTSDFVRFNQGEMVCIINRNHIIDAAYNPSTDETRVCLRGISALVRYKGNIVDKITGGD